MKFLSICKNNALRYCARPTNIIVMLFVTILTVLFAVLFTAKLQLRGNIALVAKENTLLTNAPSFNVTLVESEPTMADLMLNKYDAVVIDKGQGAYEIRSIKNAELVDAVKKSIEHPGLKIPEPDERGTGANILGYLTLFLLLQGIMFIMPYSDDKECGVVKRIGTSPLPMHTYLAAHGASIFLLVFVPAFAVIALACLFGADTGFSLPQFALLLALISLLSTAFALLIASSVKRAENCSVVGSVCVLLTTLLCGSFFNVSSGRPVFDAVVSILPQKSFLTLVQGVERGSALISCLPQIAHILIVTAVFFILSMEISVKKLRSGQA